ncbi:MAG: hypothetical protein K8R44_07885 [Sulfurimonas sp.]|nr:hypothetical protein [Sulfurimonas sp.]
MFTISKYINIISKNNNIQGMLSDAKNISNNLLSGELLDLNINNYIYTPDIAVEELGLDLDLINQLVEDYAIQIVKSSVVFLEYISSLQIDKKNNKELDYTDLRELAHKNLGVAKNLRIEDAQKFLYKMMKDDNLDYILKCLEALVSSAIILKPQSSYDTMTLMKIKKSL